MTIQVLLDPQAPGYGAIQPDLLAEMNALGAEQGVELTTRKGPPPEGTLPAAEVFQFILDYKDALIPTVTLATAVIQMVAAVLNRRQSKADSKQQPPALIVVGDQRLPLPASSERQRKFLAQVAGGRPPSSAKPRKPKAASPQTSRHTGRAKSRRGRR